MADSLAVLAEALLPSSSADEFLQRLRSDDAVRSGLTAFCSVLRGGLQSSDDGTLRFLSWNDAQIHAISSLACAIASASRSLSVEQAEGVLVAIVQQSIEFVLCYLEKSGFDSDDLGIQNNMIHLLEMALVDGINMVADMLQPTTASALVDMLPMVDDCCGTFVDDYKKCHLEGFRCSKERKSMDWLLKTLASERVPHDRQESGFIEQTYYQYLNNFVFLSQHWAIVHGKCTSRLILLCNKLAKVKDIFDERAVSQNFRRRLSFILRILKILGSLLKDVPYVEYDASLMTAVATFSDTLSNLFRIKFEFVNTYATTEGSFDSIILMVLEEFLQSVQVIFGNSNVTQNIQTCIIATILENLDSSVWTYDKSAQNLKPPLAYFPRFVVYTLKLVNDLKRQKHLIPLDWKDFDVELGSCTDSQNGSPSCLVHQESVPLLKGYAFEELLKMIFPVSSQWVANLMQLALFLHSEGLKLRPKMERSQSSLAKVAGTSEVENAVCHEDEALFGDLFSETGRSVGSTDGCEQPPVASLVSSSSYQNMPMQAATELLNFLKTCIFSAEWHPSLYAEACNKLSSREIDILLSLLNCPACDNMSDSCTLLHEDGKIGHIPDLCFDLLNNLLTNHALSDSLEDYLVDKILTVENGSFSYNDRTLTLLAHTLFCRVGSSGSQLRTKICSVYVAFVVEKAKTISSNCPSINDLVGTLPSLLILILRHMIFHQQTCPTSLLIDVRSKLREAPVSGSFMPTKVNDHMSSWSSAAFKNIAGGLIGEEAFVSSLIGHLIDISGSSVSVVRDDLAIENIALNWEEIYFTYSLILGFWRGKIATAVEDLIVERYVFSLCWDIPYVGSEAEHPIISWDQDHPVDPSNMLHFFHFSHLLLGHPEGIGKFTISPDVILSLLQHLNALPIPEGIEQLGWYFLRNGMWLSLVLSFTNVGIWRYCMDNAISGHGLTWTENALGDEKYVKLAGSMVSSMIETGQFVSLIRLFSSLLNKYLHVYQNAFLDILSNKQKQAPGFSSFLLLKHTEIDQSLQDELLERSGSNAGELQSVLSLISRLDAVVDKKVSGVLSRASWECLLHGFPFHLSTHSATMFSCVLSIRGIICVFDGIVRIKEVGRLINLETEVLGQVFDAVTIIKYDRIFESVHGKCDTIYHSLSAELELSCYENLILMKQMEGFLKDVNAGGASDCSVREWIICKIIEILNSLRKHPSKSVIFHFYLGVENVPEKMNRLLQLHLGDCLVLIDSLDSCFSESVNVKVLGFFVDLLSGEQFPALRLRIQRRFLDREIDCVSKWLEKRLLGSIVKSDCGVNCAKGSSISLRESTMNFILCLVSPPSEQQSKEMQNHIFNSALLSLDSAFLLFDIHVAKSFFNFIVQISRGEFLMKQLLMRTVMLMEKLVANENLLPGLKFLFGFIETVLSDSGSGKISLQKTTKKCSSGNSLGVGPASARLVGSRKNSESFILSANQEGGSASLECDATSVDEDEDDATSDGEVLSIDKDDEEDANSERALASKVCTFTSSGSNFMEQHWYFCYTCDLTVSKGCCSVCAKVCHRGHRVVYSRSSRFFCDCGAGGVRGSNCQCLKPRKFTGDSSAPVRGSNTFQSFLPFPEDGDQLPDSDSDFEEEISSDADNSLRLCIPKEIQEGILLLLEELDIESRVLNLCSSLLPFILSRRDSHHSKDKRICLGEDKDCQVLTLNPRGEVIDRLAIELPLQGAYIRRVDWVPGSQVQLMVVTNRFVKIYDLSLDNISPMHYFTLSDDMIVDAVLCPASQGRMFLLVLSENGNIFRLELSIKGNVGAVPLKELVQLQGKEIHAKGSSLYFSSTYKLLFVSFQDGTTLVGRPSPNAASLVEISSVYEEQESKLRPAGVHHWKELLAGSGLFVCLSTLKSNSALTVSMGEYEIIAQCMRHSVGSTSPIVGMTAYKPLSKDKIHCLVLHDDGSLQIYSHAPAGVDASGIAASEKVKKLDVKLGGDAVRNGDSEGAKQSLVNEDGFLESPSPSGFKISVFNSNPDIVMVGFRVHVGNTSASHIPSSISIFQRVVKLDEGMRSWYDIPFTVAESLLADEEFTISVGPTFNGSTLPRIDSLEVYGRAKDEFGWKEKMDAILDMEARVLGSNSSLGGSGKKRRSMQSAPMQEQVIADGLKLITKFYSSCRQQDCSRFEEARTELGKLKCKSLLETIFECDREPILQASASCVLQAVFPKKEIYHQVKDTMRLLGVVKSSSLLSSRLGLGGTAGSWIIEEFTTQMRAVCKIALQRRSNLATFLETNGSEVVDALMQVLWGILDFEQPDTQTMNNIVMSAVELIYCYAECLDLQGKDAGVHSVAPAVVLLKKLLFSSNEAVQTASSLAISSRLLQVPFPKQTMLTTDDAVESVVSVPGPADPSTGNNQIMIEDDNITSSVQYCCDGCSTVPILRRRWHCTVCPDFDLCEACYELDADRLPPPHSRDHPMTAIPIEVDSLLEQLRGWMDTTSGVQAIPVMQLFYRLSSAVGGPFIDSSKPDSLDLEKLIKWFLDEIKLNRPFEARTRSSFGEVAILVFMFFTLMLRNWHQPGSDNDQEKTDFASQLLRACDSLRQQSFVNYLMDILQQLVYVFKSPVNNEGVHSNAGPGCGALLTVRRDLPAGNFSPFFSDSYAKVHRTDIFMDYHRLLLENAFRLVYVRDSWQFSSEAKRLYKHINKSGGFQNNPIPYERSVKIVKCLSTMAEVAAARPRNWQKYCLRHGDILSFLMNGIFYFGEESVIQTLKLLNFAFYTGKDIGHTTQKMESGDISSNKSSIASQESKKKKKGEDGAESGSEKSYLDMEAAVDVFTDKSSNILKHTPEVPYSRMKLDTLKSETKFTDNRIIVKCTGSYTIQTVTMNVHDARKSKSVKVLNLYYNNRPVTDLSELKNNWSLWKRAKSCHLAFNQTELKVEFSIPITACNFMIELDSFYENLQALSLEPLQCPRCSRPVTDKHGICSNCHENAYQCRQCRNINYENLDSFLCNECGYSKYGRFEFNFMAKPSFTFDNMENDEDMKKGLAAIESESENAHRRYQQLLGFKKPLLKIVSSIGDSEIDSQQKDSVQQMMVSLPGPSCKINRKIALLGVLYGENVASRFVVSRSPNNCYGCANTFVTQCLELLQVLARHPNSKKQLVSAGILSELFENNIHQGAKAARVQARTVLCSLSEGDVNAVTELNSLIQKKVLYCLEHHRSMDIAVTTREELLLLSEVCSLADEFWESRLRLVFQLLFSSIKLGAKHPAISEHVILPCLRIISQACTPPKPDTPDKEQGLGKSSANTKDESNQNVSGSLTAAVTVKWERGASYLDFVRRQYKVSQAVKVTGQRSRPQRHDYLALKYALRWKRRAGKAAKSDLSVFELGSWVKELVLSACSQSIRSEMCTLISMLCAQSSSRRFRLLNLVVSLLPATLSAGESAAEYFELLFKMVDSEEALLFLTIRGCLRTICSLITQEVSNVESLERSLHIDITQGFILHKLIELLGKFLEVPNIRSRFMRDDLLSEILEALIVIRGLIVQKTKLISDCNRLLKDLLDSLLLESSENKRQFIRACINGLEIHGEERKGRACLFILEQLCNVICPSKPEPVYLLVLNKAHTQEEFIRGSMTKNPYSSVEIGPLMRDVKNKICHQLDLLGLLEDDYGMELLVAGNIISLDLSIAQVYEQVWKKSNQSSNITNSNLLSPNAVNSSRDCPPMTVTYRLQGLDGEATEPMIKELEEDREESQDPEVEFAIAGAVRECGGLEILLDMIQRLRDDFKSNQEQLVAVLNLLMYCCKIRENRRALLKLGALGLLLETARRAFFVDAMEPAEGILLIVESLTLEANESDNISITQSALTVTSEEAGTGEQAKKIVLMFLERLSHPLGLKKSNKQQRNTEMVARILPYLTYGEPAAMEALIQHFSPYLQDWGSFDHLQKEHLNNPKDDNIAQQAAKQRFTLENFVRVSESLKTSSCGERLKDIILEKGITKTAMTHLKDNFANAGQAGFKNSAEWAQGLTLPSVPLILSMLRGLSMGHLLTQKCIDEEGILPLLHALEGVSGENEIGARAENLLDTLSNKEGKGDGFLEEKVSNLRHATKDEMRRRALRRREELLQVFYINTFIYIIQLYKQYCLKWQRLRLLTYDIVLMLARFATGASFSVDCRGGGRESNSRFLPFMIQMARHLLDQGSPSQRRSMARAVSAYISSSSSDVRPSSPSGTQPTPGTEETVQFMMVNSFLSESYESWLQHRRAFLQRGIYHAYMQQTHSRSTVRTPSVSAPSHGVDSGSMGQSASTETGQNGLLSIIRPMLVYTGLIELLQHFFKVKKSTIATPVRTEGASSTIESEDESGNLECWEVVMKERLFNVKELLGFPKEMLSWLDEINSTNDLQEAFDIVGVLAEVLSGGFTRCEDFVQAAINAGKS
uniref:Auxin transport protein BIG n=1 Tax=Cajanus cajan TaxID=3821 RepID=A0A151UB32_CAJCA|nr:E3 ubiquitin-protein ligase UBR4 [Cajanus cajan]